LISTLLLNASIQQYFRVKLSVDTFILILIWRIFLTDVSGFWKKKIK